MSLKKSGRPLSVQVGDRYNNLVIESFTRERKASGKIQVRCHCKCDCGGKADVVVHHLKDGSTKSCGCLAANRKNASHPCWKGHGEIPGTYWCGIQYSAQRRNIKFEITKEEAWELFQQQKGLCALTGDPIRFSTNWKKDRGTASLDRLDSKGPYSLSNLQWVDKRVNKFKLAMPNAEFIELCKKVAKYSQ